MAATPRGGIEIANLRQFRADLKAASAELPRALTTALKAAGAPAVERTEQVVARGDTGALAAGFGIRTAGAAASIVNRVPYAAGAEWGFRGKWSGFNKYGPPGRFAWRALREREDDVARIMTEYLEDVIELHGWARP
jgi:hypothetical protein